MIKVCMYEFGIYNRTSSVLSDLFALLLVVLLSARIIWNMDSHLHIQQTA